MLEEEIVNREQHVLSLYRSIFDACMSLPSSSQSSGVTSPAHAKVRKHPSVISSAFCSSKKFPFQHLQVLTSIKESGKGGGSGNCVGSMRNKIRCDFSDSAKVSCSWKCICKKIQRVVFKLRKKIFVILVSTDNYKFRRLKIIS
jgi:hypothetical protein